jgi:ABC-type branched-subunit amino acid transport system permease subunit
VLGGMGSIPGVIAGAVVVYFVNSYVLAFLNDSIHGMGIVSDAGSPLHFLYTFDFTQIRNLLYGLVLILMMILRPEGLIPSARRRRELHSFEQRDDEGAVEALDAPPGLSVVGNPDGELE